MRTCAAGLRGAPSSRMATRTVPQKTAMICVMSSPLLAICGHTPSHRTTPRAVHRGACMHVDAYACIYACGVALGATQMPYKYFRQGGTTMGRMGPCMLCERLSE